ncbi:succinate dehydrogenase subunit C [Plasticicumulans lactativorans]|uniref:Succinate dehydrogenase cytochrome b556 subunit n=1 Tax=Plasticicumulans lactativorans TaxID=1133106 RepID=A0A4R2L095_9GAMM|nr:succinate dehydrogenase, cytochrome b556 subunit [Plasticicumulans lactativorans]TCO80421.1 succinate dehydrogenase subunit C [Plasticicumulans lactativorans]
MATNKRPLSPFMIGPYYKPQLTSVMSITHRLTGVALSIGTVLLVYWLAAAASGPEAYEHAQHVLGSMLGQLFLFCWTWALFYHLCNGLRHLYWDSGRGFDMESVYKTGKWVQIASVVLTVVVWIIVT